ncbi:MAG: NUDIX domain-containing protein [Acidimicrobiales bacterium]
MQWIVHGERALYESEWVNLAIVDVEIPDERRFDHHVIRVPRAAAGTVIHRPGELLLLWRHRFITDTWGWEVPAGKIEDGEAPIEAAEREALEESGWQPGPLRHLTTFHPTNGMSDQTFHIFLAEGATYVGEPTDRSEATLVEWVPISRVREFIASDGIRDGLSLCGVAVALARGLLD